MMEVYSPMLPYVKKNNPVNGDEYTVIDGERFYEVDLGGGKNKTKRNKKKHNKRTSTICYKGYGANKTGNHTGKQFRKTMRKHHVYDCLDTLCMETKDKKVCKLSRKCNRRNNKKKRFTTKKWVKWSGAHYGKCKK